MNQRRWHKRLERDGFLVVDDRDELEHISRWLGRSGPPELLKARAPGEGWSHSDAYGYGAFPWHTDGAVSPDPPRWFVLTAISIREQTTTSILKPNPALVKVLRRTTLRVRDRRGTIRYLPAATAEAYGHRLRWDPRIATPTRNALIDDLEAAPATANINWSPGRSVIIDNHLTLHRRPSVTAETERTLARYYIRGH